MKTVNVKLFAILYKLDKVITKKLDEMKKAIIEGADTTFKDYAKIKVVDCTRASYDKEAQAKIEKFAQENGLEKVTTNYKRVEIDGIALEIDNAVDNIINTLEDSNNTTTKKVASKISKQ